MFTTSLLKTDKNRAAKYRDPAVSNYTMVNYGYSKKNIRIFQLKKDQPVHEIIEYKVNAFLRLATHKEYYEGDNSDIVGSDVLQTTVFLHAQKFGLTTPEEFALSLTQYLLDTYDKADAANLVVDDIGWERLGNDGIDGFYKNKPHNHGFLKAINMVHYCEVVRERNEDKPLVISGIKGMRLLKTAQSSFVGYQKSGNLFTEGDLPDRIFLVEVNVRWQYAHIENIDFKTHWRKVRDVIFQTIYGDPVKGKLVTSSQHTSYSIEKVVLDAFSEISAVEVSIIGQPNFPYDFSRIGPIEPKANVFISEPNAEPHSFVYNVLKRDEN